MAEIVLTAENFEAEVINSDKPILVDFWAPWCGPCRMIAPVVAEIAYEYRGVVKVGKVNIDDEPALAESYQVSSIPTILYFKDGKIIGSAIGVISKEQFIEMIGI